MKKIAASLRKEYAVEEFIDTLSKMPDPDFVLAKQGLGREHLRKLESDDDLSAAMETRREALVATPWRFDPYTGPHVKWLASQFEAHIDDFLRAAWSAVPYGYSVIEVVYENQGPHIGIAYLSEKPFEWFEPKRDGRLVLRLPGKEEGFVDTSQKFFLTKRNATYNNPYGEALLSRAYWPWYFRHNLWRFWMQYLERFADPLLMGRVIDSEGFLHAMQAQGFGAVVAVDRDDNIDALTQSSSGEFIRVEEAVLSRYHRLVLGQTLTSDIGDYGSFAAAKVHDSVRDDKRRADIRLVSGSVQKLVDALWALNRFPGSPPLFIMQDSTGLEIKRAERDALLVNANIVRFTPEYIRSKYSLEDSEFVVPTQEAPSEDEESPDEETSDEESPDEESSDEETSEEEKTDAAFRAPPGTRLSEATAKYDDGQNTIEDLVLASERMSKSPLSDEVLRQLVLESDSPEALAEKLAEVYLANDPEKFRMLFDRALLTSEVVGFVAAKKERR